MGGSLPKMGQLTVNRGWLSLSDNTILQTMRRSDGARAACPGGAAAGVVWACLAVFGCFRFCFDFAILTACR